MKSENKSEVVSVHRNVPQLLFQIVQALWSICIWGRATGKTEGPMTDFTVHNLFSMPRSNGFLVGTTYDQILTRTLPPLIAGWERYGLFENKHYWIRKYAPDKLKLPKAYRHPVEPTHYIHVYNGSGIYLVSQDRPGTINGVRSQWGAGDEARLLDKKKLDEDLIPTMAGHADLFGDLSNYLSLLFCSDMPRSSKGKWLLDFASQMDAETISLIVAVHNEVVKLQRKFREADEATQNRMRPRITKLYHYLNELRKGTVYFSLASTLDNIHTIGLDAITNLKRILSETEFRTSVLNQEIIKLENGYYSLLSEDEHGYDSVDYSYVDSLDIDYKQGAYHTYYWDDDVCREEPLDIGCDHNNAINCIVTGQLAGNEYRFLSSQYVLNPLLLRDMVVQWHAYYQYHKVREVNYFYDATSVGHNASRDVSFADEVSAELRRLGWVVVQHDIGQLGSHHSRYYMWGKVLQHADKRLPMFRYNKTNCKDWFYAAQQAGILKLGDKIKKDKRPERDTNTPPEQATHLTEAGDILLWGRLREMLDEEGEFVANMVM